MSVSGLLLRYEWLAEYIRYRELFFFLVWRDVKIRYKQTVLGASWAIIQPFLLMVVFSLLFGRLAKLDTEGIPYPLFYYSGLVPFTYFQQSMPLSGNSMIANTKLINKVYFPRAIIPAAPALGGVVDFSVASLVLIGMMFFYGLTPTWEMLMWPVLVVPLVFIVLSFGMFFSALNVKYRDIKYTIPFFVQAMMFVSGVISPARTLPEKYQAILQFNPMVGIIDAFRASILPSQPIDWGNLGISCAVSLVLFTVSFIYFRKTERQFADII